MKFSPLSEQEAKESAGRKLLEPGEADFEVQSARDKTSKAGNEMIELCLKVWDSASGEGLVWDYLVPSGLPHRIRHFAYSVGLGHVYERGELDAEVLAGKSGRCKIRIESGNDGYPPKNTVADYVVADTTKETRNYQAAKSKDAGGDPKKTPRGEARLRFLAHVTQLDPAARESAWRQALDQFFGHADQGSVTDADWQRFAAALPQWKAGVGFPHTMRAKVEQAAPIGDAAEFDDSSIPF